MKPRPFSFRQPASLEAALADLAQHGTEARVLAGGQSLMPMMALRLVSPAVLVDINRLAGLDGIACAEGRVRIGALVRHRRLLESPVVRAALPLLAEAARHVAHLAIRNRGSFGGSLSHADPAAEFPACALLLGAEMELASARGTRRVPAAAFFQGAFTTALAPDELLTAVHLPARRPGEVFHFAELARRSGDFALCGVAARALREGGALRGLRLVGFGIADRPLALPGVAALAEAIAAPSPEALRAALLAEVVPLSDPTTDGAARTRMMVELLRRALLALRAPERAAA